jgi:lipopolysaccharide assembly protein A
MSGKDRILSFLKTHWVPILLVILASVFIAENRYSTTIELFWLRITSPLWLILLVLFAVGFAAGRLSGRRKPVKK